MFDKLATAPKRPFYAWLVGVYPILHLYAENLGLVQDREALHVCAAMLAATSLAFLVVNRLIRCPHKTAAILSLCSIVFSLSGHLYILLFLPNSLLLWTLLVLISMGILLVRLWTSDLRHIYPRLAPLFNLILLALLTVPCSKIISSYVTQSINVQPISASISPSTPQDTSPKVHDSASRPDIYYIIPDGYLRDSLLSEAVGYDNSAFSQALADRGFIVIEHAQSNYAATLLSLASILNMQYFDHNPSPYTDLDFLRFAIADNEVGRLLKQYGYTYVQLLSGFWMPSPSADIIRDFTPDGTIEIAIEQNDFSSAALEGLPKNHKTIPDLSHYYKQPFTPMYLGTTLLRIVSSRLYALILPDETEPYGIYTAERFLNTVSEVESIARMPAATFTVIHLLKPHLPIVFEEDGALKQADWHPSDDEFIAQYRFVNSKFLEMIDTILQVSWHPPVIVFQSDHGASPPDDDREFKSLVRLSPYAAYHLPRFHSIDFPKPFTLINTFPLLLNEIFDTDFALNDDRIFELPLNYDAPFEQRDATSTYLRK